MARSPSTEKRLAAARDCRLIPAWECQLASGGLVAPDFYTPIDKTHFT
jgi:hypothetical protein